MKTRHAVLDHPAQEGRLTRINPKLVSSRPRVHILTRSSRMTSSTDNSHAEGPANQPIATPTFTASRNLLHDFKMVASSSSEITSEPFKTSDTLSKFDSVGGQNISDRQIETGINANRPRTPSETRVGMKTSARSRISRPEVLLTDEEMDLNDDTFALRCDPNLNAVSFIGKDSDPLPLVRSRTKSSEAKNVDNSANSSLSGLAHRMFVNELEGHDADVDVEETYDEEAPSQYPCPDSGLGQELSDTSSSSILDPDMMSLFSDSPSSNSTYEDNLSPFSWEETVVDFHVDYPLVADTPEENWDGGQDAADAPDNSSLSRLSLNVTESDSVVPRNALTRSDRGSKVDGISAQQQGSGPSLLFGKTNVAAPKIGEKTIVAGAASVANSGTQTNRQTGTLERILTLMKINRDAGIESPAGKSHLVGILDSNGEIKGFSGEHQSTSQIQLVAVPIQSPNKMSPHLLPKPSLTQQIMSSPARPHVIQMDATSPWSAKRRAADYMDGDYMDVKRAKKGDKGGKGLRHFSMKVCEKVQTKGVTSYNEVADELVAEFSDPRHMVSPSDSVTPYDQKNIRRRVYDALNVLMAMNIISKEKKEIRWIGLPVNSAQECQHLEVEKQKRIERIKQKTQQLQELILQQIAFKNLVQRNRDLEKSQGAPAPNSAIQLPFIIVNTSKKTVIDCSISNDKYEYLFKFDNTFEIHDDIEVLKRMGMAFGLERGQCTTQDLARASKMVPKSLESYVLDMANNATPFQSSAVRPIDPASAQAQQVRYQQQSTSQSTSSATSLLGLPGSSSTSSSADGSSTVAADREVLRAMSLSRQSSLASLVDQNSRGAATDTPSVYSEEEEEDETDSDRSSPVDL